MVTISEKRNKLKQFIPHPLSSVTKPGTETREKKTTIIKDSEFSHQWVELNKLPASMHFQVSSVQFSRLVVSDSLQPHELQHTRPLCPSPTPGVHPNPRPSSQWCPTISSSVFPFSSCPQSFPASGSFQMSRLFEWSDDKINHTC